MAEISHNNAIGAMTATIAGKPKTLTIGINRFFRYINPSPENMPTLILNPAEVCLSGPSKTAIAYNDKLRYARGCSNLDQKARLY